MQERRFRLLRWGWRLLFLALITGGWTLSASALHAVVVPTSKGTADAGLKVLLVPKNRLSFSDTYIDTRPWKTPDAQQHETLVSRLIEAGQGEHLSHVLSPEQRKRLDDMLRMRRAVLSD